MLHFNVNYTSFLEYINTPSITEADDIYLLKAVTSWLEEVKDSKESDKREETIRHIVTFIADPNKDELSFGGLNLTKFPPIFPMRLPTSCCKLANQFTQKLKTLYLANTEVTTLPDCIGNLPSLTSLYIYENKLTCLPDSIGDLANLTLLNLSNNELTTLPDSLRNLTALNELDLSSNQLATLPKCIKNLSELRKLYLGDNKLAQLPNGILSLPKLEECDIVNDRAGWNWSPGEKRSDLDVNDPRDLGA